MAAIGALSTLSAAACDGPEERSVWIGGSDPREVCETAWNSMTAQQKASEPYAAFVPACSAAELVARCVDGTVDYNSAWEEMCADHGGIGQHLTIVDG